MAPKTVGEPDEITGQSALPIARIKKIIQLDEDIVQCSNNATFVIAMATEMFIQYLAEQGHTVVKSERKPRKTVQYKDLASAVSHTDNLEFLSDVIPKTTTYRQFKEKKAKDAANQGAIEKGQRTLNGTVAPPAPANGTGMGDATPQKEDSKTSSPSVSRPMVPVSALIADRAVEPMATHDHDVEMQD
ncbi:transcriptional regulator family: Histone-like TF [Penicillium psychrosexuale]|uniref:transcriptional regulator family: Histone-like TF n=1 Tax=Penicillium psychrosexuale TaxID=1002107 RepID=UPI0025459890|nr:transcriptional regulator family: Histone-like TF [Penicillium psychrosexuale]KAJ5804407.1 transcriptional regulator family: Histone-like TF [Penicillium psychrosexuale]